ncbi:hypothetical protein RKD19_002180 [Streptomyces canus]
MAARPAVSASRRAAAETTSAPRCRPMTRSPPRARVTPLATSPVVPPCPVRRRPDREVAPHGLARVPLPHAPAVGRHGPHVRARHRPDVALAFRCVPGPWRRPGPAGPRRCGAWRKAPDGRRQDSYTPATGHRALRRGSGRADRPVTRGPPPLPDQRPGPVRAAVSPDGPDGHRCPSRGRPPSGRATPWVASQVGRDPVVHKKRRIGTTAASSTRRSTDRRRHRWRSMSSLRSTSAS